MKVESGVATSTALQKIKVKEEKEECSGFQQQTGASMSTATTTVTTITITTHSNANSISANNNNNTITNTTSSLGSTSSLPIVTPSMTTLVQPTSVTRQPPVLKSNLNNNNSEQFFIDLDVKAKTKVTSNLSREKLSTAAIRDESNFDSGNEPSNAQKSHHTKNNNNNNINNNNNNNSNNNNNNNIRSENKVNSRSSDNDSPLSSSQTLQIEKDEASSKLEEIVNNNCEGNVKSNASKSISTIFSGHSKLRRLLGTLVHFAMDISPDTGDTVRSLVIGLLNGAMSAEDFHSALQEATNFPLRGFVLPYLKHTLPSLQRDLNAAARINNQSCVQYLRANESAVLEAVGLTPSGESVELFGENVGNGNTSVPVQYGLRSNSNPNVAGTPHSNSVHHYSGTSHSTKRRASDTPYYENGTIDDGPIYGKRSSNHWSNHHHHHHQQQQQDSSYCWYQPLHSAGGSIQGHQHSHGSSILPNLVQINQLSTFAGTHLPHQQQPPPPPPQSSSISHNNTSGQNGSSLDDVWKNIYVMLGCISSMVDKTKQALTILQRRGCTSPATPSTTNVQNGNSTNGAENDNRDGNIKRLYGENVAQTIRATEDKVAEVQRRAEEAVHEVKRAAVAEIQRAVAVAVAESRVTERYRFFDSPLTQRGVLRQSPFVRVANQTANTAETSRTANTPNSRCTASLTTDDEKDPHLTRIIGSGCWNCGRQALETCGGCGVARYCGSFCQHRDWEAGGHHANCNGLSRDLRRSSSQSPPRLDPNSGNETDSKNNSTVTASISISSKSK
ncbi:protein CBFA2T2 isoform X2 [Leptopilina boulardi]|nr:protein CBFA2T2 isoform X2 [Leptopilina boulardi]XP_051170224.1 protein CBFA2T2 isoform X2 [Leptopilina boulardi]XP_051170225.1 protein CBFA2T2 isoform X2 [Leptopilina boulardi]XP_051170226.1 protein CBFA2T2 isoform X2 [Leptopilina boulardi]XP_051170227.1 protein CBFA2T2 isoform X2 [Leptopilina boulardi]XP_051170228.1 protein CBFA2T2 isoform X2 [Leptopilina boulardi]XP_051170229.1 protein CBFA2T2 isoform X2 [Leptopilina boulardi]XP_051170230.1 protein CBFA2T2 isoform X2 [Leptopilina boula